MKEFYTNPFEVVVQIEGLGERLAQLDAYLQGIEDARLIQKAWEAREKIEKPRRELHAKLKQMAESKNNMPKKWRF